ncbi:OLC1v1039104C1 [Oldenlandia corymbosa var. corymbosa]|uniref:Methyltransferase n=1 Tax=Oldenlandia corymbosa var. corymbosa TaxID=529605 RepID=A0AAV1D506_OLDCO|nr:OLC1v1039104C1 [Oldenlandia corymbosa var. corymbosa]
MASPANLPHYLTSKFKKTNLFYLAMIAVLCSLCYMIGIWQHGGLKVSSATNSASSSSSVAGDGFSVPELSCNLSENNAVSNSVGRKQQPLASVTLDFAAHHSADDLVELPTTEAREDQFSPCKPELSEYTPCEDQNRSLKFDRDMLVYRERHCPEKSELLKCRIPAPYGYKTPFRWPESRDMVWYANVPHKHLTVEKANQNWVRFEGDRFTFPGGGTMFPRGAKAYIDDIGKLINLKDGSIRTAVDTGCGVASWGAYLFNRNIISISIAPRDNNHVAQVQFALERGVPALIGVLASIRLPYPSRAFDMAHCSRCLIPWGKFDGVYLTEIDRILRPGGYWILSGPPINWENRWKGWERTPEDLKAEQDGIEDVAKSLCWKKVAQKNDLAIWQKPTNHKHCIVNRKVFKKPQFCKAQDPDRAWYTKMETCITPLPEVSDIKEIAGGPLANWPERLTAIPPRIASGSLEGITVETFEADTKLWKKRVAHYKAVDSQLGEQGRYRNLLDMNAHLGGFAAALVNDPVWVMNVVPVEASVDTLGVIYERGLIGTYQNWCEAMSTYPRTYDFIHADSVFSLYDGRCEIEDILLEMDRILRPQGSIIIRDDVDVLVNVKAVVDRLQWQSRMADHEDGPHVREKLLVAVKEYWTSPATSEGQ